jgi:VanZ family protein
LFLRYNLFPIIWAVVILALTVLPGARLPEKDLQLVSMDKLAHVGMFMIQCFLLVVGFIKQQNNSYLRRNAMQMSLVVSVFYGISIELIQMALPERSFEFLDIISDSIGAFLGLGMFYLVYKI